MDDVQNQQDQTQPLTKREKQELRREEKELERQAKERKQIMKRVWSWTLVVLFIVGGVFGMIKLATQTGSSGSASGGSVVTAVSSSDWKKGNGQVLLMEYSDFECPACAAYFPFVKRLAGELGNEMQLVYRHFPLPQHQNAERAARVAEAAGLQGKFWEMHDMIFENQKKWAGNGDAEETFLGYGKILGLDVDRLKSDMNSESIKNKVKENRSSGLDAGVNSTPTFFVNGKKITPPRTYEDLKNVIIQSAVNSTSSVVSSTSSVTNSTSSTSE